MDDQGHDATSPWQMPIKAWIAVAKRTWAETSGDNIGLIAAGVAFYGFLALVPLLGAIVLVYGIAAEPATVMRDMTQLTSVMPSDVAKLVGEQLMNVVKTSDGKKGLGLLLALGLALFGARNGAGAIITALNVAYEEEEKRGFLKVNLLALAMTAGSVVIAMLALVAITALGALERLIPDAPGAVVVLGKIGAYLLLALAGAGAAATLYRYGPSRERAQWVWLTPGSLFTALMSLVLTIGFGIYVANFGNYNATYGSLGAVVVTLTWLYLSSYILLFGAELNSELEHQTARDTTRGDAPLGERGAWAADHVADGRDVTRQPFGGLASNLRAMPLQRRCGARRHGHERRRRSPGLPGRSAPGRVEGVGRRDARPLAAAAGQGRAGRCRARGDRRVDVAPARTRRARRSDRSCLLRCGRDAGRQQRASRRRVA